MQSVLVKGNLQYKNRYEDIIKMTRKTIIIGTASLIALILIFFLIKKAKAKKAGLEESEGSEEEASFGNVDSPYLVGKAISIFPLKQGSKGVEVERLQRFLDRTLEEKKGRGIILDVHIGTFDYITFLALKEALAIEEVSEEFYKRFKDIKGRKIAHFNTKKIIK